MLTGQFENSIDEKGRLSLPAKLRTSLSTKEVVLTQGQDTCLWVFTNDIWKEVSHRIMEMTSPFNSNNRLVLRTFIAPAQELEIDGYGRIAIPPTLRDFAKLVKDCIILGIDKYIEIWDTERYKQYIADNESNIHIAAEGLGGLTFTSQNGA